MHKCEKCRDSGLVSTGPEGTYGCTNCECTRGENSLVIANEPQCEPAIMVDGKIITVDDYQALQAENKRLNALLARHNDGILRLIGLSDKRERIRVGETMREETLGMMQPLINKLESGDEKHENI